MLCCAWLCFPTPSYVLLCFAFVWLCLATIGYPLPMLCVTSLSDTVHGYALLCSVWLWFDYDLLWYGWLCFDSHSWAMLWQYHAKLSCPLICFAMLCYALLGYATPSYDLLCFAFAKLRFTKIDADPYRSKLSQIRPNYPRPAQTSRFVRVRFTSKF